MVNVLTEMKRESKSMNIDPDLWRELREQSTWTLAQATFLRKQ